MGVIADAESIPDIVDSHRGRCRSQPTTGAPRLSSRRGVPKGAVFDDPL